MARDGTGSAGILRKWPQRQPEDQPTLSLYLRALAAACMEAASNPDPRVLQTLASVFLLANRKLNEESVKRAGISR
jgi:hypothetical protein